MPLVDAVIGDAGKADLAVRPRLPRGPFDAFVEITRLARREMIDEAGRAAGAARVDAHAGVAVRDPFLGIDDFPVLIFVGRPVGDIRMTGDHPLPCARIAFLEGKALGIGAVGQQDGTRFAGGWPKHIRPEYDTVVDRDVDIPVDRHPVLDRSVAHSHASRSRFSFANAQAMEVCLARVIKLNASRLAWGCPHLDSFDTATFTSPTGAVGPTSAPTLLPPLAHRGFILRSPNRGSRNWKYSRSRPAPRPGSWNLDRRRRATRRKSLLC